MIYLSKKEDEIKNKDVGSGSNVINKNYRDYDSNPLIINDYNPLITFYTFIFLITPIVLAIAFYDGEHFYRYVLSLVAFGSFSFRVYMKTKGKRKIILKNSEITYMHEDMLLESILISNITSVKKGFQDFYTKKQEQSDLATMILILVYPLELLMQSLMIITKTVFKIYKKGISNYRFFDSVIIFEDEVLINIFPTTKNEYQDLEAYLRRITDKNIEALPIFYKLVYREERFN